MTTVIGSDGVGTFSQTGGTHDTNALTLGKNATGTGTYRWTSNRSRTGIFPERTD